MKLMNLRVAMFLAALAATATAALPPANPAVTGLTETGRVAAVVEPTINAATDRTDPKAGDDGTQGGVSSPPSACSSSTEGCCEIHPTPGCEDPTCCDTVCASRPACCNPGSPFGWDATCRAIAFDLCGDKCEQEVCDNATGSCCELHPTPGCDDPTCCDTVCASRPACCNPGSPFGWDATCRAIAFDLCGDKCEQEVCDNATGSCCELHPTPGCDDPTCCDTVCASRPACCNPGSPFGWDATCRAIAFDLCGDKCEQEVCDNATGSCCELHPTPGCDDPTCCDTVCASRPACCNPGSPFGWDATCRDLAIDMCPRCTGACCLPTGCTQTIPGDCTTPGGFQGLGTACEPTESCCFDDGSCEDLAPVCCAAEGGTTLGESTSCAANCCNDLDCPPDPNECIDNFCDAADNTCKSVLTLKCRVNVSEKGSLLYFSGLEVGFSPAATTAGPGFALSKDTFITLVNDLNREVCVEWHFINGDPPLAAIPGIERAHPGWNSYDCVTCLTPHENVFMSLARGDGSLGCQPFTGLDPGTPPGRPDPDGLPGDRILRGFAIAFAVDLDGNPISWNHLSGHATVVDYRNRSAWEYNTYAFPCAIEPTAGLPCGIDPTTLSMDDLEYGAAWDRLLFDFYAVSSMAFSRAVPATAVTLDTELTLHPVSVDLRPNSTNTSGPVLTRADIVIWNENEDDRTGTTRCINCWDQTLLSDYDAPNNFLLELLNTDKGKARIDGVKSDSCDAPGSCCCATFCRNAPATSCSTATPCGAGLGPCEFPPGTCFDPDCDVVDLRRGTPDRDCSENAALLGLSDKILTFLGALPRRTDAAMTLVGTGNQPAAIQRNLIPPTAPLKEEKRAPREGSR